MEKIKKYIPRIILLDTIIYTLIIVTLYLILSFCKLMFREWIYIVSAIIIMFGFVAGIIQLLLKIKKKIVKVILISIFVMLFLLSTPIIYFFGAFGYTPEHVVEKDGQKFVAYVNGFNRTYVNYYNYKNTNASKNVVNLISPNNYNFVDGIYAFKGMGPHYPRRIFVYKGLTRYI